MPKEDTRDRPALERFTRLFYDALKEQSKRRNGLVVFEGHFSKLFGDVVGNPRYYTSIRKTLVETESIEIIQKGNAFRPTICVLHHPPPADVKTWPIDLTGAERAATMSRQFEKRVASLEAWREQTTGGGKANIAEVLRDYETRIAKLEKEQRKVKSNGKTS